MAKKIPVFIKLNSKQEKVEQSTDGYIIYVKEPPIENRANTALIRILAKYFNVPKSYLTIVTGLKSRRKTIELKD